MIRRKRWIGEKKQQKKKKKKKKKQDQSPPKVQENGSFGLQPNKAKSAFWKGCTISAQLVTPQETGTKRCHPQIPDSRRKRGASENEITNGKQTCMFWWNTHFQFGTYYFVILQTTQLQKIPIFIVFFETQSLLLEKKKKILQNEVHKQLWKEEMNQTKCLLVRKQKPPKR